MTCGITPAIALRLKPHRRTRDAERRHHGAAVVANRRGDAHHAEFALLVFDGAAALAHDRECLKELVGAGDGLGRARRKPGGDHPLDHVAGLERQDRLALGGAMHRFAHADVGAHADRVRALEIVDVHDLVAVEDREMDALVDLLPQLVEITAAPRSIRPCAAAPAHRAGTARHRGDTSRTRDPAPACPSAMRVEASRWTVLLASPSRRPSALMPISTSSSENALSRRIAVATDESRSPSGGASLLPIALGFAIEKALADGVPLYGPMFRSRPAGRGVSTARRVRSSSELQR